MLVPATLLSLYFFFFFASSHIRFMDDGSPVAFQIEFLPYTLVGDFKRATETYLLLCFLDDIVTVNYYQNAPDVTTVFNSFVNKITYVILFTLNS